MAFGAWFLFHVSNAPKPSAKLVLTAPVPQALPTVPKLPSTKSTVNESAETFPPALMMQQPLPLATFPYLPHANQQSVVELSTPVATVSPVQTVSNSGTTPSPLTSAPLSSPDSLSRLGTQPSIQSPVAMAQSVTKQVFKPSSKRPLPTERSQARPTTSHPTQARSHFHQAIAAQKAGNLTQAERLFLQTIALDPSLKEAYNSLGNLYYQREDYQRAKSMYQHALDIDADYVNAHNNLGSTYMRLARHAEAIAQLRQAISLDSDSGLAYYNLACVYARTGDESQAAKYLSQAIERDPAARTWAQTDADFTPVRTTPALQKLLGAS